MASFLSLCIVLAYGFDVMVVSGAVCIFYLNNYFENVGKKRNRCIYFEVYL